MIMILYRDLAPSILVHNTHRKIIHELSINIQRLLYQDFHILLCIRNDSIKYGESGIFYSTAAAALPRPAYAALATAAAPPPSPPTPLCIHQAAWSPSTGSPCSWLPSATSTQIPASCTTRSGRSTLSSAADCTRCHQTGRGLWPCVRYLRIWWVDRSRYFYLIHLSMDKLSLRCTDWYPTHQWIKRKF